jgi:hypothetical protein
MSDHLGYRPENIANMALVQLGTRKRVGSLREGSVEANAFLEVYATSLEEISRGAPWNFSRKQQPLKLLQDASGNSAAPVGTGTPGMGLWLYEYAWPIDCLKARYVPYSGTLNPPIPPGNILPPDSSEPPTTVPNQFPWARTIPAPFQVTTDMIPVLTGAITNWNQLPDLDNAQGQSFNQQTVILTNQQSASIVYTARIESPNLWDPLFRQAMASMLAAKVALTVIDDRKLALAQQATAIKIAKDALEMARVADGNEMMTSNDHIPDWIRARRSGGYGSYGGQGGWGFGGGLGNYYFGWESTPFPDGTAY